MAEFVLKDMVDKLGRGNELLIESAGTSREEIGNDTHYGTKQKLKDVGIPFTRRYARQVTKADYENFDYLICMDSNNVRNLRRIISEDKDNKISLLLEFTGAKADIADPWYTGNFDRTYEDVVSGCEGLLKELGIMQR